MRDRQIEAFQQFLQDQNRTVRLMIARSLSVYHRIDLGVVHNVLLASLVIAAGLLAGATAAISPTMAMLGMVLLVVAFLMVTKLAWPASALALTILLSGYAFLGRGFAYVGFGPIFIGEVVLALILIAALPRILTARITAYHGLLLAFAIWGGVRTVTFVGEYEMDALRDAALWSYAIFALLISLLVRADHFPRIVTIYGRLVPILILWIPVAYLLDKTYSSALPAAPGSDIPLLWFKGGDAGVHLAGAAAFLLIGLQQRHSLGQRAGRSLEMARRITLSVPVSLLWPFWMVGVALAGTGNRGGLVTVVVVVTTVLLLSRSSRGIVFGCVAFVIVAATIMFDVGIETERREVSISQLGRNLVSVVSPDAHPELGNTSRWRMEWWSDIYAYTIKGPYFWTGKGFGVNLADDDGYAVLEDSSLRSPHSAHMSVLARMGVPGLLLWLGILLALGSSLLKAYLRSRRRGDTFWSQIYLWLFAYLFAMVLNMSFDVYLEGPQGGIWFWSVAGLALAALAAQQPIVPSSFNNLKQRSRTANLSQANRSKEI